MSGRPERLGEIGVLVSERHRRSSRGREAWSYHRDNNSNTHTFAWCTQGENGEA